VKPRDTTDCLVRRLRISASLVFVEMFMKGESTDATNS
jgi:hypothetical protein